MKIRYGLVLAVTAAVGLSAFAGGTPWGARSLAAQARGQMLQQGQKPRQTKETKAAQKALDQAGQTQGEAEARVLFEQALASANLAIAADSMNPLPYLQAGTASIGLRQYPEADAFLTKAEALRPIYSLETDGMRERTWINLYQEAAPLVNSGEYEGAAAIFENANAMYDKRPEIMITLGQIYAQLRRHDDAIRNLDAAMAIIEDSARIAEMDSATVASWNEQAADIPFTRAQVLADAGRFEEAVSSFQALVDKNPQDLQMRRNLAAILIQTGDTVRAFQVYEDLLAQPGLGNMDFYAIGVGFYQGGDYARAAMAFKGAAERAKKDRDAIEMWARSLQIDSAYAEVPAAAEQWIALDPNNQNAMLILAQAVNQQGDGARAGDLVRQIEALPFTVNDLQLMRREDGARVTGSVMNKTLAPGTQVTLGFTFYDAAGNTIGTQAVSVTLGQKDMSENFDIIYTSTAKVDGYGYTVLGG
ncbi:MAG: tetratricopeptide repeat protein [Gemmatimonadetes bacterium]|nr:tetratricopeptide repeat protein [Gemmatimonadota bacterium]